jgi:parallel beta-helix repeat protein
MPSLRRGRHAFLVAATFLALIAAGLWGAASAAAAATTLYVGGPGCSDSGQGTELQPYCTIVKAATVVLAGQTVRVAAGTYSGRVVVTHSGTAASPIVLQPAPGAVVTVTGGTNGFVVSGKQYVTITGFTVTGTTSYGISLSSSSNLLIASNTVSYSGQPVSGSTAAGIYLKATTNSTITGNNVHHNTDSGIRLTSDASGNTVSYNESSYNAKQFSRSANGIYVAGSANTILGNLAHHNEDSGLHLAAGGNNSLVALNVSHDNGDHGIDIHDVTGGGHIVSNTVYRNCTSGINVEGTSSSFVVQNNIAVDNAVFVVNPTPMQFSNTCKRRTGNIGVYDSAPATTTVDSNLVWLSVPGKMYVFGSAFTSLSAMQAATGQEAHGRQADPMFVDRAAGDLRLSAGSPAIDSADSGAVGAQASDIAGRPRVDDPTVVDTGIGPRSFDDRGAYEFQPGV